MFCDFAPIIRNVFSYHGAPLCCLRKLVQNGRHIHSVVRTTELDEYSILRLRGTTGVFVRMYRLSICLTNRVVSIYIV